MFVFINFAYNFSENLIPIRLVWSYFSCSKSFGNYRRLGICKKKSMNWILLLHIESQRLDLRIDRRILWHWFRFVDSAGCRSDDWFLQKQFISLQNSCL